MLDLKSTALAVIVVAGLFMPEQLVAMAPQKSAPGAWKQYRARMAGFELRYPHDWNVYDRGKGRSWSVSLISPAVRDDDVSQAVRVTICSNPVDEPFTTECRERDSHLSVTAKDRVRGKVVQTIGGLSVERLETEEKFGNQFFHYAHFTSRGRRYFVRGDFTRSFGLDRYAPTFHEMLASIRTFTASPLETFESARYSFSLTYPASWKPCPVPRSGEPADGEQELLRLVPVSQDCSGPNVITVSRSVKLSGNQLTGFQLQEMLTGMGFTRIASALSGNMRAQGEKRGPMLSRGSYVFINLLSTNDLLKISERYEMSRQVLQEEGREIPLTLNDTPPN